MPTKSTTKKTKTAAKEEVLDLPKVEETKLEVAADEDGSDMPEFDDKMEKNASGTEKYYEAVGRRKEATARVRVFTKKSTDNPAPEDKALVIVNGKPYYEYFRSSELQAIIESPLRKLKSLNRFKATVKLLGGGSHGQADAVKFGLSRALVLFDPNFSKKLRKAGYLTRDAREKERRKYGLKKARKAPAWSKR